ncbi:hypothetical protein SEVIR_8G213900v4 [Setaria viridis]|nr:ervatamin-B-like [Setaria viridis]
MAATLLSSSMALALLPLLLLAAASIPSLASASPALDHGLDGEELLMLGRFHGWMAAHGRSYANEEEKLRRFKIYRSNMELIEAANQDGRMSYQLGETPFTDLTHDEFMAQYSSNLLSSVPPEEEMITTRAGVVHEGGGHGGDLPLAAGEEPPRPTNLTSLPASIDWRMMGVVTVPKNQGACGSCWAFASVATIESAQAIRTRRVPPLLSEQQLVDCDGYDQGCRGGFLGNAFRWVIQNGGITWAPWYPYTGMSGMCQRFKPGVVRLRSYRWVAPNEVSLMQAVAQQPVAVTIDASDPCFQHYYGGVYDGRCFWNGVYIGGACGTAPNHAIAIVGYGTKPGGTKYWIGKNSWSVRWGDQGFVYLLRDSARVGVCGVAQQACYPII